jgi:hypothetical protein
MKYIDWPQILFTSFLLWTTLLTIYHVECEKTNNFFMYISICNLLFIFILHLFYLSSNFALTWYIIRLFWSLWNLLWSILIGHKYCSHRFCYNSIFFNVSSNANNEMDLQLVSKSSTCKSVIVCSKNISSQCKVTAVFKTI